MATQFDFTKVVSVTLLRQEIEADPTIVTALDFIILDDDALSIFFVTDLSGAEVTALNAVVAAHTGVPPVEPPVDEPPPPGVDESDPTDGGLGAVDKQKVKLTSEVTTTSGSFVDLPGMFFTTKDLGSVDGCYLIFFSGDLKLSSGSDEKFELRIQVAGSTVCTATFSRATGEEEGGSVDFNAEAIVHLESAVLNESEIKVQWRKVTGSTLRAKRRELSVLGVPTGQVLS